MTPPDYSSLTDSELSAAVATRVAGWRQIYKGRNEVWFDANKAPVGTPAFATDLNQVIPLMEKQEYSFTFRPRGSQQTLSEKLFGLLGKKPLQREPTLARACCIALLRAADAKAKEGEP